MATSRITIVNRSDGSVEAHRKGCQDTQRKRHFLDDSFDLVLNGATKQDVWVEYNSDFLAEEPDGSSSWPIRFLPCLDIPKGAPAKGEPVFTEA